jgi:hypothetical protein
VLSLELGKMVAERQVRAGLQRNRPEPMNVHLGNDYGSTQAAADRMELAERLKTDGDAPRDSTPLAPPDPNGLARGYLSKAGYSADDLNTVTRLLHVAESSNQLEKQVNKASGS